MKIYQKLIIIVIVSITLIGCNSNNYENSVEPLPKVDNSAEIYSETEYDEEASIDDYLFANSYSFSIDDSSINEGFREMEGDLRNSDIILTGEFHGIQANYQMKMALIKFIKERANFKYLLCEIPYSTSFYLNKYLETGDKNILDQLPVSSKDTLFTSEEDYMHWKSLYEFNQTLTKTDKIIVIGVDLEYDMLLAFNCIKDILINKDIPIEMQDSIALVDQSISLIYDSQQNKYKAVENCEVILQDIEDNREVYKNSLQDDLIIFETVIRNIVNYKEASKKKGNNVEYNNARDRMIYDNFTILDSSLPKGKYFGQFGAGHVLQEVTSDIAWFASYLDGYNSKYNGKVLSIIYNYINCEVNNSHRDSEINLVFDFIRDNYEIYDSNYTLYKLNNVNIKRPDITILDQTTDEKLESDVSNYFQYIILMKDLK